MNTQVLSDMDIDRLRTHADGIPSLGVGRGIGPYLIQYARLAYLNIVEIGAWMGSNSGYLSIGRLLADRPARHHVFDPFSAEGPWYEKALKYQHIKLATPDSLLKIYKRNMKPFGVPIEIHRESAFTAEWHGGPIDLFVDDYGCSQGEMEDKIRIFYPSFIPGKTIIIMVDYYFHETHGGDRYQYQRAMVKANRQVFEFIERAGGSKAAIFLYCGGQIKNPG